MKTVPSDTARVPSHGTFTRRRTLAWLGAGMGAAVIPGIAQSRVSISVTSSQAIKAVAFDAFAVFDPQPVFASCEREFPGHGMEIAASWRTRLFEYQWLRALGGRYANFEETAAAALEFAVASLKLESTASRRDALVSEFLRLRAWPDVSGALALLKQSGLELALLSNATKRILDAGIANSALTGVFDHVISTDRVRTFKPDPRAYQLGVDTLGLGKREVAFVASAGWDAAGARWFGFPTYWNNRLGAVEEQLDGAADRSGATLDELVRWMQETRAHAS